MLDILKNKGKSTFSIYIYIYIYIKQNINRINLFFKFKLLSSNVSHYMYISQICFNNLALKTKKSKGNILKITHFIAKGIQIDMIMNN